MRRVEILLIGNTDFVTKQWIEHAFPHDKVVVALRKGTESSGEDLKIIDMPDRDAVSEVSPTTNSIESSTSPKI